VERWKTVAAQMTAEREHNANEASRLRAENERLKTCGIVEIAASNSSVLDYCKHWEARAEKAEAELITERARLDYLGLHMGMPQVSEALNLPFSQCFPIRDAIDLAMKNETTTP
jgi:hypothetical protein